MLIPHRIFYQGKHLDIIDTPEGLGLAIKQYDLNSSPKEDLFIRIDFQAIKAIISELAVKLKGK